MDKKLQIQLGSTKNIDSTTVDTYDYVSLENQEKKILEYDIRNVMSVTEIFEAERQFNEIYRIYGDLEYFSLLNGIKNDYRYFEDFFIRYIDSGVTNNGLFKDINTSFTFFLVKPSTGYTKIANDSITYIRMFEVIATSDDFDLFNAGYSKNLFNEQKYGFIFNKDFDVSEIVDDFGFPLTELFLYPVYNRSSNAYGFESMYRVDWDVTTGVSGKTAISPNPNDIEIGDIIYGDKIEYSESTFLQVEIELQTYYITTPYENQTSGSEVIWWKYNPFIPIRLRYLSNEVERANTGGTIYDQTVRIPDYATPLDNQGNVVWRDILQQGYIDPLTGEGVDYPFVNKRRYLFSNIKLNVIPDLNDEHTATMFTNLKFGAPTSVYVNVSPNSNLDDIGKPCK